MRCASVILSALLICGFVMQPSCVSASWARILKFSELYGSASFVAVGRVIGEGGGMTAITIEKVYKGTAPPEMKVYTKTGFSSVSPRLREGYTYLLFMNRRADGFYSVVSEDQGVWYLSGGVAYKWSGEYLDASGGELRLIPQTGVRYRNLTAPKEATVGEPFRVTLTLENIGDTPNIVRDITFIIDEAHQGGPVPEMNQPIPPIEVAPHARIQVPITVTFWKEGVFAPGVEDPSGRGFTSSITVGPDKTGSDRRPTMYARGQTMLDSGAAPEQPQGGTPIAPEESVITRYAVMGVVAAFIIVFVAIIWKPLRG